MTTRILPREEWHKLDVTKLPAFWKCSRPEDIEVTVVEDGGEIVGCAAVLRAVCVEGLWISKGRRGKAGVARALKRGIFSSARRWADLWAFGIVGSDEMHGIMEGLEGERLKASAYVFPLKDEVKRCA